MCGGWAGHLSRSAPLADNFLETFPTSEVLVYLVICSLSAGIGRRKSRKKVVRSGAERLYSMQSFT